ncbi:MAG: co-chaperone GroES [Dehalococcoidales bacterium]|nr:co-chaperone GroES [Dehalococcoidales bacterium]MDD5604948.1 co-chaperone GroES [Dehalococcoidales bacterium]MDX9986589.1 co-chaperone GroES [Dehalococcoidales bacterium]NLE90382.1 co-chaperone GroES [Dehalococcoidales bacterium]
MAVKIQPLGDRVLVKPIEAEEVTKGGIVLPASAQEKPLEGKVLATGPGKRNDKGEPVAMDVKTGDVILYSKYGGTEIKIDGEELIILTESNILAKRV